MWRILAGIDGGICLDTDQLESLRNSAEETTISIPTCTLPLLLLTNPLTGNRSQFSTVCPFMSFPVYHVEYPARCRKSGSVCRV